MIASVSTPQLEQTDTRFAPISASLRAIFGTDQVGGLVPGLVVDDDRGWIPATHLIEGPLLATLLKTVEERWQAAPHVAAALTWKLYAYWLALPAALGWASARRVPLATPEDVLLSLDGELSVITLGFRRSIRVATLPTDPLALAHPSEVLVVADDAELLRVFRDSLLDQHIAPLVEATRRLVRIGPRTLLGALASGIAYGLIYAADVLPGSIQQTITTLLTALGVEDLVELVPGPDGTLTVQRRTCCLAFTLPEPKVCPGCCVKKAADRAAIA
ncbi:MAG TPA: hypothetical protein VIL44_11865 [Micromonospora sp.]